MKVTISCFGKFWAFHLAEQLDKCGYLEELLTTYYSPKDRSLPLLRNDNEIINPDRVITNIYPDLICQGARKFDFINNFCNWDYLTAQMYDDWSCKKIKKSDIVVAWSNSALKTLRQAKLNGSIAVLERGSTHILYQKKILEEEYEKYGIKIKPIDEWIVNYELEEYNEADYICVPSCFARDTYSLYGVNGQKVISVPYGVDLSTFKKIPKEDNVFRIIFLGGLTLRKGVHYLLEAYAQLKLKNAELLLIGALSPECKPFLKRYEGNYKYIGKIPHLELHKYLSRGSVFVLPSIEDGFAMVILQAMACAMPVICTTNTAGYDVVREGKDGFVISIRDVEKLKEKISYLYNNQDICKEMGRNAYERVSHGFTWDDYGKKIINAYKNLIKNSNVN